MRIAVVAGIIGLATNPSNPPPGVKVSVQTIRVMRRNNKPIFNVVTPPWGSYTHTFDEPGVYNVTCDIHTTMHATVHVASMPYVGTADEQGRFTFEHVVPGSYAVSGFSEGAPPPAFCDTNVCAIHFLSNFVR